MKDKKHPIYALATFVGTIIGVGLFAIPYVGAQSGFIILLFFLLILGGVSIVINLFYGEVAAKTKGLHRLPGYANLYLGSGAKRIAFIIKTLGLFGALLAYLIVGGQFLASLLGGSVILYTFIFFILGAFLIWQGTRSIGPIELILLFIFLAIVLFLFISGVGKINVANLSTVGFSKSFIPYGVVLFSLWGTSMVPEIKEMLKGDLKKLRKTIITGIIICIAVYLLFSLLIIGITGQQTTEESISGLEGHLGQWILVIGYIFGIITTFTSFIALGLTIKKIFWYDYHLPKWLAWALASFIPLILFIIGLKSFIDVIGLTGALMLGSEGIMITLLYLKLKKKEKSSKYSTQKFLGSAMILLLVIGVILEIFYFFKG